jgi:hypothetical protein
MAMIYLHGEGLIEDINVVKELKEKHRICCKPIGVSRKSRQNV